MKSLWEEVREELKDTTDYTYTREKVIKTAKRITSFGSHFMRKVYVAHSMQFKPKRWQDTIWINKILCHKKGNLDTALNYSNVTIADKIELTKAPVTKKKTAAYTRLLETVKQMTIDDKPLTHINIKAKGFGSSTISRHLKDVLLELGL